MSLKLNRVLCSSKNLIGDTDRTGTNFFLLVFYSILFSWLGSNLCNFLTHSTTWLFVVNHAGVIYTDFYGLLCRSVIEVRNGLTFLDLIVVQIEVCLLILQIIFQILLLMSVLS